MLKTRGLAALLLALGVVLACSSPPRDGEVWDFCESGLFGEGISEEQYDAMQSIFYSDVNDPLAAQIVHLYHYSYDLILEREQEPLKESADLTDQLADQAIEQMVDLCAELVQGSRP